MSLGEGMYTNATMSDSSPMGSVTSERVFQPAPSLGLSLQHPDALNQPLGFPHFPGGPASDDSNSSLTSRSASDPIYDSIISEDVQNVMHKLHLVWNKVDGVIPEALQKKGRGTEDSEPTNYDGESFPAFSNDNKVNLQDISNGQRDWLGRSNLLDKGIDLSADSNGTPEVAFKTLKGNGTLEYSNGDVYHGDFVDNDFMGHGTMIFGSNGDKYTGQWRHSQMCGQGRYTYAAGDWYEGGFVQNKFNGYGVLTYRDGTKYQGEFVDDVAHGSGTLTYYDESSKQMVTVRGHFYSGHFFGTNLEAMKYKNDAETFRSRTATTTPKEVSFCEEPTVMMVDSTPSPVPRSPSAWYQV